MGSNLIKLTSTTAKALKEKDDQVYCQPELLYEGKTHPLCKTPREGAGFCEFPWDLSLPHSDEEELCPDSKTEDKQQDSWGAPAESIEWQFSFKYLQTSPRKALGWGGWLLDQVIFTAGLCKRSDLLNADLLNRDSVSALPFLYFKTPCQDRGHQPHSVEEEMAQKGYAPHRV